ncbi:transposase [Candidatus Palauibacter sp.]|uniref:transposase n=1 Tax=Candidatus Palauibacter sp. TaxID=3101350 RepID=UPI003CC5033A
MRAGRSADQLAREFEPSATAIRRWVELADRDEGLRKDDLTTAERKEVRELKRELRRVKRDILANSSCFGEAPRSAETGGRPVASGSGAEVVRLTGAKTPLANMTWVLRGTPQC